ncbi:PLD nuclease N-terminal domain-containing protein [Paenibacillus sp. y28]|uniref:PLD nuclease N-terminal domain-containing protein n=1 Tax=Paenibacillus sp. y28 TaxID=3129110 RepID=UPI003015A432
MSTSFGITGLVFLFMVFVFFMAHVALCIWAYRDALSRGRSREYALIVLLAMLLFPLMGLIIYLLIRND